jgi:hypothetical protein
MQFHQDGYSAELIDQERIKESGFVSFHVADEHGFSRRREDVCSSRRVRSGHVFRFEWIPSSERPFPLIAICRALPPRTRRRAEPALWLQDRPHSTSLQHPYRSGYRSHPPESTGRHRKVPFHRSRRSSVRVSFPGRDLCIERLKWATHHLQRGWDDSDCLWKAQLQKQQPGAILRVSTTMSLPHDPTMVSTGKL